MPLEVDAFVSTGATLPVGKALVMDAVTIGASTGVVEMVKLMDGTIGSSAVIAASSAAIGGVGLQTFVVNSTANPIGVSIAAGQSTVTVSGNVNVTYSTASTGSVIIANTTAAAGIVQLSNAAALVSTANPLAIKVENALGSSVAMPISGNTTAIISTASKIVAQISSADIGGSSANALHVISQPYSLAGAWVNISTVATSTAICVLFSSAASTRFNLTSLVITNAGTAESVVRIFDGATTISALLWRSDLASAGGGVAISMPVPIRGTSGAAVVAKTVPASTVYMNVQGFKTA